MRTSWCLDTNHKRINNTIYSFYTTFCLTRSFLRKPSQNLISFCFCLHYQRWKGIKLNLYTIVSELINFNLSCWTHGILFSRWFWAIFEDNKNSRACGIYYTIATMGTKAPQNESSRPSTKYCNAINSSGIWKKWFSHSRYLLNHMRCWVCMATQFVLAQKHNSVECTLLKTVPKTIEICAFDWFCCLPLTSS